MAELPKWFPWRPTRATLVAAAIVTAGILLTGVSWWFVALVALGAFGPGVLRELGWLNDKDEFQRRAAQRAGYHAFLVAGLAAFFLVAYFRSGDRQVKDPQELSTLFLVLLWCTWLFSSLFAYWGARKTAVRILLIFGTAWLLFVVAESVGERTRPLGFIMHSLPILPFFIIAYIARRLPRVAGVLLVGAAAFLVYFFGWYKVGRSGFVNQSVTMILFIGPLLASGAALLGARGRESPPEAA